MPLRNSIRKEDTSSESVIVTLFQRIILGEQPVLRGSGFIVFTFKEREAESSPLYYKHTVSGANIKVRYV